MARDQQADAGQKIGRCKSDVRKRLEQTVVQGMSGDPDCDADQRQAIYKQQECVDSDHG